MYSNYQIEWETTYDGQPLYKAPLSSHSCRDVGAGLVYSPLSKRVRELSESAYAFLDIPARTVFDFDGRFKRALTISWFQQHRDRLRFLLKMYTPDNDKNMPLIQINNDHIIDRLSRKWPTLNWEPAVLSNDFSAQRVYGATVYGDYAILQAMYWFIVLQRVTAADTKFCSTRLGHQWDAVNKLIERHATVNGVLYNQWPWLRCWDNLRQGTAPDYTFAWSYRHGPIQAEEHRATYEDSARDIVRYQDTINQFLAHMTIDVRQDA